MNQQDFVKAGFTVIDGSDNSNPLLSYLKEHYPSVIRDNEVNLNELKSILGLPVDDKVNGYGLNFIGRNFARAKYQQETDKAVSLNTAMSKDIDTTQNLVLKGDNLDSLKILKNYYKGQIKCIYIDPPYNTDKDEFVYPDKFDKEEAEILGLVNLSEDDFARLDFSFKTKKSHNGWLSFIYPRLLLAQELLSNDGVIFISIDDNEQANLKLLCDDVFGEENFIDSLVVKKSANGMGSKDGYSSNHEFVLVYKKNINANSFKGIIPSEDYIESFKKEDEFGKYKMDGIFRKKGRGAKREDSPNCFYPIYADTKSGKVYLEQNQDNSLLEIYPKLPNGNDGRWIWSKEFAIPIMYRLFSSKKGTIYVKDYWHENLKEKPRSILEDSSYLTDTATNEIIGLFGSKVFSTPKPIYFIKDLINNATQSFDIILDFFAGSATTGHSVMKLNAEDNSYRKFILCQIDEVIDEKKYKDEYKFCIDNNLPPVISSITIERLNRAGEAIKAEIEKHNTKKNLPESNKKQLPDIGYKVFDSVPAPKLAVDDKGQIAFPELHSNAISRIYNMIFKVGIDEPSQVPMPIIPDCMYQLGDNYYITDSHKVSEDVLLSALKDGTVYIDGWTASLDVTLQSQKDKVKIVF